jgi:hypothetical protein
MKISATKNSLALYDSNNHLLALLGYDHIEEDKIKGLILMRQSGFVALVDGAVADAVRAAQEAP